MLLLLFFYWTELSLNHFVPGISLELCTTKKINTSCGKKIQVLTNKSEHFYD